MEFLIKFRISSLHECVFRLDDDNVLTNEDACWGVEINQLERRKEEGRGGRGC